MDYRDNLLQPSGGSPRKPECKQERQQIESDKTDSRVFLLLDAVGQNSGFPSLLPWICIYCLLPGHVSQERDLLEAGSLPFKVTREPLRAGKQ